MTGDSGRSTLVVTGHGFGKPSVLRYNVRKSSIKLVGLLLMLLKIMRLQSDDRWPVEKNDTDMMSLVRKYRTNEKGDSMVILNLVLKKYMGLTILQSISAIQRRL